MPPTTRDLPDDGRAYSATGSGFVFPIKGRRPFAVMIDNQGSRVLPQGGLDRAQIVYEIIVEGGITRFMPVFWVQGAPAEPDLEPESGAAGSETAEPASAGGSQSAVQAGAPTRAAAVPESLAAGAAAGTATGAATGTSADSAASAAAGTSTGTATGSVAGTSTGTATGSVAGTSADSAAGSTTGSAADSAADSAAGSSGAPTASPTIWDAVAPAAHDGNPLPIIGPVRSARHYFLNYALEHDAIYFHIGQSYIALREFRPLGIDHVDSGGVYHDLTRSKNNWQDSFTSSEKMLAHVEKQGYRTETSQPGVFDYYLSDQPLESGAPCSQLKVKYSASYFADYAYDAGSGLYMRSRNGKPHMARETESSTSTSTQISAKNIVIQFIRNSRYDSEDRQELHDVGNGEGWLITLGKAAKIRWSKASRGAQTVFAHESGEPLILNPGQTFVQIVPLSGEAVFS
ncbi:MAG: DUF3048 domain-containing protein [Clostridiales bacterium]|jgi:hypothetical protein|nr:DUF3048 domain-containing protein [Clostridiales bacterium]